MYQWKRARKVLAMVSCLAMLLSLIPAASAANPVTVKCEDFSIILSDVAYEEDIYLDKSDFHAEGTVTLYHLAKDSTVSIRNDSCQFDPEAIAGALEYCAPGKVPVLPGGYEMCWEGVRTGGTLSLEGGYIASAGIPVEIGKTDTYSMSERLSLWGLEEDENFNVQGINLNSVSAKGYPVVFTYDETLLPEDAQATPDKPETSQQPAQTSGTKDSGSSGIPKLSKQEMIDLLNSAPLDFSGSVFASEPSITAPYAAGKLTDSALQAALDRLNALRRIAGLPAVSLSASYNESAQYAAVIQACLNTLSHTPSKPAGMDDSFYQKAYDGANSSNLYAGRNLFNAVDGWMDDSDGSNVDRIGHRRWQLSTSMDVIGFGYAQSGSGYGSYVAEKVFERGSMKATTIEYNYIGWPASGNFPNDLSGFTKNTAWSVTLNPKYYSAPKLSDVTVTITRESDGKQWVLSGQQSYQAASTGKYLNTIEQSYYNYGGNHCIIFRPDGIDKYEGVYTVSIQGLKDTKGAAASLSYQVDFFATKASAPTTPTTPTQPTTPTTPTQPTTPTTPTQPTTPTTPTQPTTPTTPTKPTTPTTVTFSDVKSSDWFKAYVEKAATAGLINGTGNGMYEPQASLELSQALVLAYQIDSKATGRTLPQSSGAWYMPYYQYCLDNGIITASQVRPTDLARKASRFEMVSILDKAVPAGNLTPVKTVVSIPDLAENAPYGDIVYKWYRAGILSGDSAGRFNGSDNISRAEVAVILCQLNGL